MAQRWYPCLVLSVFVSVPLLALQLPTTRHRPGTALHLAAMVGALDRIPTSLLTAKNLNLQNHDGMNAYHAADCSGHLNQLPAKMLTESNLFRAMRAA
jgi:hypothetical protein